MVWTDTELARIEIVTLDENGRAAGATINVTERRGRYASPRFASDVRLWVATTLEEICVC